MEPIHVRLLETDEEIITYEKLLFEMFSQKNPSNIIFDCFDTIDGCRLRSKIVPLSDQVYCVAEQNDVILAGMSGNVNCSGPLQLEYVGFSVDRNGPKFMEGLAFFAARDLGVSIVPVFDTLISFIGARLKDLQVDRIYSTCSQSLLRMYEHFGFTSRDRLTLPNGEEKHLICYEIEI